MKQITGLSNYRSCGHAIKLDLVAHPELLEQDEYAARSAAWFFASRGCLLHSGDVERVTLLINGGRNGLDKRRALFNGEIGARMKKWLSLLIPHWETDTVVLQAVGMFFILSVATRISIPAKCLMACVSLRPSPLNWSFPSGEPMNVRSFEPKVEA